MHLAYFDETKYTEQNPYFHIGGVLIPQSKALELDQALTDLQFNFFGSGQLTKENEFHGKDMFHGKGAFKRRSLPSRLKLFEAIASLIVEHNIPVRLVCVDVPAHRRKYVYPMPEYSLALMLILERFCDYLDKVDDLGLVFGDYEKDEITRSVVDFSQFKHSGSTPMYFGRALGRLVDTVYFTQSHHSRFLQVADALVFMAGRYENGRSEEKWQDATMANLWRKIKASTDFYVQRWP